MTTDEPGDNLDVPIDAPPVLATKFTSFSVTTYRREVVAATARVKATVVVFD